MLRLIIYLLLLVFSVVFAIQNSDHVPIFLIYGKPLKMRMVFVIAVSGIIGYLLSAFASLRREDQIKKQLRYLKSQLKKETQNKLAHAEQRYGHEH